MTIMSAVDPKTEFPFSLSPEFWSDFVDNSWGKQPRVVRKPFALPLLTSEEAFHGLVTGAELMRSGEHDLPIAFYIEYAKLMMDAPKHLPSARDISLHGYNARVSELTSQRRFALIAQQFQMFDAQAWLRVREFLSGLFRITGLPGEDAKSTIFLGNYLRTPLGLHQGRSHNFMYVIEGVKRIRVWPASYFTGREIEHTVDYDDSLEDSILLEGKRGDILYWPSGWWHIGESEGEFSIALSTALFMTPAAVESGTVQRSIRNAIHAIPQAYFSPSDPGELDDRVECTLDAMRETIGDFRLKQNLKAAVLNHKSAAGFSRVPPPDPNSIVTAEDHVKGNPVTPILISQWDKQTLLGSVNGHSFLIPGNPQFLAIIDNLNEGETLHVANLLQRNESLSEEILFLLNKLCTLRALVAA